MGDRDRDETIASVYRRDSSGERVVVSYACRQSDTDRKTVWIPARAR